MRLIFDGTDIGHARGFYSGGQGTGECPSRWIANHSQLHLATLGGPTTLILVMARPRQPEDSPTAVQVTINDRAFGVAVASVGVEPGR